MTNEKALLSRGGLFSKKAGRFARCAVWKLMTTCSAKKPCSIPTAHYVVFDELPEYADVYWVINVSNFRAALLAGRQVPGRMRYVSVSVKDDCLVELLEDILLASVEVSGGARNISGFYGISDKLANLLRDWLADEKIILDC